MNTLKLVVLLIATIVLGACGNASTTDALTDSLNIAGGSAPSPQECRDTKTPCAADTLTMGAARIETYGTTLEGKRVALYSNHTGMAHPGVHTLDLLLAHGVDVVCLFSPEHGFRGTADAGEHVGSSVDSDTGLPIVSLYGPKHVAAMEAALDSADVIVVDIQDVGTRFYTYYCTMLELMDAAAMRGLPFMVLDRPNPIGMMVDGPVLDMKYASGVGRLPIPVAHGLTLGELALMANGEGWLPSHRQVMLTVVPCLGYTHQTRYRLPVAPSPNLRSPKAIYLYPSMCYFEATDISLGRGTDTPFLVYGHPSMEGDYAFTPQSMPGATRPPQMGKTCHGVDLSGLDDEAIIAGGVDLSYIIDAYRRMGRPGTDDFFTPFFELLIGDGDIRSQIAQGMSAAQIRAGWQEGLDQYKHLRSKYLIYPE